MSTLIPFLIAYMFQTFIVIILLLEGFYKNKKRFLMSLIPMYPVFRAIKEKYNELE